MTGVGKHFKFTLIELMVSIAVFLLLLVMMLQFLAGTQQIWKGTSGRGDVFVESKAAMDLFASLLREANYAKFKKKGTTKPDTFIQKNMPFYITPANDGIAFLARSPVNFGVPSDNDVYFFVFKLNGNELQILGIPAVKDGKISENYKSAIAGEWTTLKPEAQDPFSKAKYETIIKHVTDLKFYPLYRQDNGTLSQAIPKENKLPAMLMVHLSILPRDKFIQYEELDGTAKDDFRADNELTFSRIIYFDNRDYTMDK